MKTNRKKAFDCVAFKRRAALRLHEEIGRMSPDREERYWQKRNREFSRKWEIPRSETAT